MKSKIISIVVIVVVALLITVTLVNNKKQIDKNNKVVDRTHIPVNVSVSKAQMLPSKNTVGVPAVLEPKDQAMISIGSTGKLESLNIELGSKVNKGQILGKVDTKIKQADLKAKELTVAKLKADYDRNVALLKGNAISETNVTDSKYNYETNELVVEQLRQQIADANIVSPINGIITDKKLLPGEYVNMGTVIASVVDVSQLKAIVYVSESDIYYLSLKQKATITTSIFPEKTFEGEISYISPKGDDNHKYQVEVMLDKKATDLKAGTYITVTFRLGLSEDVLQIPKMALAEGIINPYVFVISNGKAKKRPIVLGREIGENFQVLEGLKAGDEIITDGKINVVDGSIVNIQK